MSRPRIYRICDTHEEGKEVFIKSTMKQVEIDKLIMLWQIRLEQLCNTMSFCVDEIVEILEAFGCTKIDKNDNFKSYWDTDIFEVWEGGCSPKSEYHVSYEDLSNHKWQNEKAVDVMYKVYKRTMDYYEEKYGKRD